MIRKRLVTAFLIGFYAGFLLRGGISAAQTPPANAISVDVVAQQWQEKRDLVLVDVRDPREFERVNIPGSINIPLFAVKTKAFLKGKSLVLVDQGYSPRRLADACEHLKQAGFDARFLFGGLNAWRAWSAKESLLPLQDDMFAQRALNKMPPQALFAEQDGKYWLIIDVSASGETHPQPFPDNAVDGSPGSAGILPASYSFPPRTLIAGKMPALPGTLSGGEFFSRALSVPFEPDNPEPFLSNLERAIAQASARSESFLILIYNQYGEDYQEIERVLRNTQIAPVFFLKGGIVAYKQFVTQQTQIKQGYQQEVTMTCPSCPR